MLTKKSRILSAAIICGSAILLSQPASAKKEEPKVDPAELAKAQNADFKAPSDVCYSATVAAFQTLNYDITMTDKTSGLVKAQSVGKSKLTYNIIFGFGGKKRTQTVTAFVESAGPQACHIRLNYVLTTKKTGIYGTRADDGEAIMDIALYQKTFEVIGTEVNTRTAASAAAAPAEAQPKTAETAPASPAPTGN
jgi:hypothetical protein